MLVDSTVCGYKILTPTGEVELGSVVTESREARCCEICYEEIWKGLITACDSRRKFLDEARRGGGSDFSLC